MKSCLVVPANQRAFFILILLWQVLEDCVDAGHCQLGGVEVAGVRGSVQKVGYVVQANVVHRGHYDLGVAAGSIGGGGGGVDGSRVEGVGVRVTGTAPPTPNPRSSQ